jgi:hypothetical protein
MRPNLRMDPRRQFRAVLTGIAGSAMPVFVQAGKRRRYRIRLKIGGTSVVTATIEDRYQYDATVEITKRSLRWAILNVKAK